MTQHPLIFLVSHLLQASMMGIQTLRDKPGLALDSAIVHGGCLR